LERSSTKLLAEVIKATVVEKARRLPLHSMHRWWSRRFAAVYRFILASYLVEDEKEVIAALSKPWRLRNRARGKIFFEPFTGGGTGISEAVLAGWDAYGVDINPVAVRIATAEVNIASKGFPEVYFCQVSKALEKTSKNLSNIWEIYDGIITYTLITRSRAPTWLSTLRRKGTKLKVLLCPNCRHMFLQECEIAHCPICGETFMPSMKPTVQIKNSLPEPVRGWKAFAMEYRVLEKGKYVKKWVSLLEDKDLAQEIDAMIESSREKAREAKEVLSDVCFNGVVESKRLKREGGIVNAAMFFTDRQLASFLEFSKVARVLIDDSYLYLASIAVSESAKSSSMAAKWHPPLGEPVPAGAMKTYWIPEYTVETNPLAHEPGTFRTFARNTIASSIRGQLRAVKYVNKNGGLSGSKAIVLQTPAHEAPLPHKIDLAVVDPPYFGVVKSYASISLVHMAALHLFCKVAENTELNHPKEIEKEEIGLNAEKYEIILTSVLQNIVQRLTTNGRIVLMYNNSSPEGWRVLFHALKKVGLFITAIYWTLGEPPGGLARSSLRGVFLIVLTNSQWRQPYIVVDLPLETATKLIPGINLEKERKAFDLLNKIKSQFNLNYTNENT